MTDFKLCAASADAHLQCHHGCAAWADSANMIPCSVLGTQRDNVHLQCANLVGGV